MIKKLYADGSAEKDTDQTRPMIKRVAEQISNRVGSTLGPGGRNYLTPEGITNDGVSILKHIRFSDEREDSLADVFEEVARRQDADAGDGTTTATTMLCAGVPVVLDDVSPIDTPFGPSVMEIKSILEKECKQAVSLLEQEALEPVDVLETLKKVARTSMENNEASELIAETIYQVGSNSNTVIEDGFNEKIEAVVVPGIEMPLQIETASMFTNLTRKEATYTNPIILVANHVFETVTDVGKFITGMIADKKEKKEAKQAIVIIGKQFSVQFTAQIVTLSRQAQLPILLLSAKGLKDEEMQDIATYVGGKYIDTHPKEGSKAEITYADAGTAKKILAGPKQTSIIQGEGIISGEVSTRVADLKALAEKEQNPQYREELKRRAAGLGGGVATLYVDAKTAVDRYYLKKKVEDAMNSCKAVYEGGTVAGGGTSLALVAEKMEKEGAKYLPTMLRSIHERVQKNAGGNLTIGDDVVDAFYTNKCAIENSVAILKILVTTEGVIAEVERSMVDELANKLGYE